jgi:hypothetical protein
LSPDFFRQQRLVQIAQAFAVGQPGLFEQPGNAPLAAIFGFALAEVLQELPVAPVVLFGLCQSIGVNGGHPRQIEAA